MASTYLLGQSRIKAGYASSRTIPFYVSRADRVRKLHSEYFTTMVKKRGKRRYTARRRRGYGHARYTKRKLTLQQEHKFFDTSIIDAVVPAIGLIQTSPNLVPQNVTEKGRIGRRIIVRHIHARFQCQLPSADDVGNIDGGDTLRIMILVDHQANGAAPAILDILETATYNSYRNLANINRFDVLVDKFITFNRIVAMTDGTNTSGQPTTIKEWRWSKKVEVPIEFDSTAGALTEIQSNNIVFFYISAFGLVGVLNNITRIRYDG